MSEREINALVKKLTRMSIVIQVLSSAIIVVSALSAFYFNTRFTLSDHEKRINQTETRVEQLVTKHDNDIRSINDKLISHIDKN